MDTQSLKKYINKVYELESSLYTQNLYWQQINSEIQYHSNIGDSQPYKLYSKPKYFSEEYFGNALFLSIFVFVIGAVIGFIYGIFNCIYDGLIVLIKYPIFFGLVIGIIVLFFALIFSFISYTKENISIEKENTKIQENNLQIELTNKENRMANSIKVQELTKELTEIYNKYSETKEILEQYYQLDIIFPKYRNIVAICSFYEYTMSGRCSMLEGHEGAYNIYENEIRQNLIITKLEDVIERLDKIEDNQYMLFSAIQQSTEKLNSLTCEVRNSIQSLSTIESNTAISAYHSEITAQNTEYLKWYTVFSSN